MRKLGNQLAIKDKGNVRSFATCSSWSPRKPPQLFPTENNMGGDSGAKAAPCTGDVTKLVNRTRPARITDEKQTSQD
jgi:hypothetical protein